jgi:hypothetical protein
MRSLNKKGQLGNLAPAILALTFAAIVLVMGVIINQELRDTRVGTVSASVTNESVSRSITTGVGTISRYATTNGFGTWNASLVLNTTTNVTLVEGTHYRIFTANGSIGNITMLTAAVLTTYTYTWGDEVSIVIGLLLVVFAGRRER